MLQLLSDLPEFELPSAWVHARMLWWLEFLAAGKDPAAAYEDEARASQGPAHLLAGLQPPSDSEDWEYDVF